MIYELFRMPGHHETLLDFSDLIEIKLRGDDVLGFDTMWDDVLMTIHETPSGSILESLCRI